MAPTIPACSLLVALTLGTSPRCRSEPLPPPSVPELRSELRLATDEIDWVYQGKTTGLALLFNQRASTTMSPSRICKLTEDEWSGMEDALISAHSELRAPAVENITSSLAKRWVSIAGADYTEISFSKRTNGGEANVGVTFAKAIASAEVGTSFKKSDLILVVGDRRKAVTLEKDMVKCVLASLCIDHPDGGEFVRTVHYGSLVWLDMNENHYDVTAGANALKVLTIKGKLDKDSLSITGGLVGSFSGKAVGEAYGTQKMITDISTQDIIHVQRGIRSIAASVDIIGITKEKYTNGQCSALFKEIEGMP